VGHHAPTRHASSVVRCRPSTLVSEVKGVKATYRHFETLRIVQRPSDSDRRACGGTTETARQYFYGPPLRVWVLGKAPGDKTKSPSPGKKSSLQRSRQSSLQRSRQSSLQRSRQSSLQRSRQSSLQRSRQSSSQGGLQSSSAEQFAEQFAEQLGRAASYITE
jgi:hypothetical protein